MPNFISIKFKLKSIASVLTDEINNNLYYNDVSNPDINCGKYLFIV